MLLDVNDLEVAYGDYQVVWGVSLSVAPGESVALLGPNGSGKSTVVNTISGLLPVKAGDIRFEGTSLVGRPTHTRASLGIAHVLELKQRVLTIVMIEHNMQVIMRLADRILALHAGRPIAFGVPEQVRNEPAVVDAYLGTIDDAA